jgi:CRP/FNR family nitrogen fixation transcriptional regulator
VIARYPRRGVELLADSDPQVGRHIRELTIETAFRMQRRVLILGRASAVEKVGAFLLEMADRSSGANDDAIALPMSRYDIADYLALSAETVSRALTLLNHRAAIRLTSVHSVRIIDRHALEERIDAQI